MNINSQISSLPLATVVNQPTDGLRRDNNLREVNPPPAPTAKSTSEQSGGNGNNSTNQTSSSNSYIDQVTITTEDQATPKNQDDSANVNNNSSETPPEQENAQQKEQNNNQQSSEQQKSQELADQQQISVLKKRDQEVRTHESAHAAVGGSVTGAPSFSFERGPDGKNYAVNGEVSVDLSPIAGDPRATIAKMQKVHAAALAPINPSSQDKQVAAAATQTIAAAQSEILNSDVNSSSNQARVKRNLQSDPENKTEQTQQDNNASNDFDTFINSTLKAQDKVVSEISKDVQQRALRIESFYSDINQAYSKSSTPQFQLTA